MNTHYTVNRMNREELVLAVEWAAREGWNPGINDADCFYTSDPNGFFYGKLDNEIIAVGSAVRYDAYFAFCGFYIVSPSHRGLGYGLALTKERLAYVGTRNTGIDGVPDMLNKYARLGYRIAHTNARYCISSLNECDKNISKIIALSEVPFASLLEYDRRHFPAPRKAFLDKWINQPESLALGWVENGLLQGYGVIRSCLQGFKIGPLFADTPRIADQLFTTLASYAKGDSVYLDIAENNPEAQALTQRYRMEKIFETARMYLKGEPQLRTENIYGITTFELG